MKCEVHFTDMRFAEGSVVVVNFTPLILAKAIGKKVIDKYGRVFSDAFECSLAASDVGGSGRYSIEIINYACLLNGRGDVIGPIPDDSTDRPKNNDGFSACQFGCGEKTVKREGFSAWYDVCPKCGK